MSLLKLLGFGDDDPRETATADAGDTETMRRIAAELEALPEDRARYLAAFAYILGRVAYADSHVSAEETQKMEEIVRVLGHVPEAQAVLVVEIAKCQVKLSGGTDNFLVSRRFRGGVDPRPVSRAARMRVRRVGCRRFHYRARGGASPPDLQGGRG